MLIRASEMQRGSEEAERDLKFVNQQIEELTEFKENLDNFDNKGDDKEILASLGKGVYVKSNLADEEKLFVEVGAGIVVRKTKEETKKAIESQLIKFKEANTQLREKLEFFADELNEMITQIQSMKKD